MDLIDINRVLYLTKTEHTFFSSAHVTFDRTDHILACKTSSNKHRKNDIIPSNFSGYKGSNLEINYKKKARKSSNTQKLNNTAQNDTTLQDYYDDYMK